MKEGPGHLPACDLHAPYPENLPIRGCGSETQTLDISMCCKTAALGKLK